MIKIDVSALIFLRRKFASAAFLAGLSLLCGVASANPVTLFATWSGAPNGNSASATGNFVLDSAELTTLLSTPGFQQVDPSAVFTSMTITVSGSTGGNGIFTLADFSGPSGMYFDAHGANFNLAQDWVGQATSNLPWGSIGGNGGDFNFFSNGTAPNGPVGDNYFELGTNADTGEILKLTSVVEAVPEPAGVALSATGLLILGWKLRRRQQS